MNEQTILEAIDEIQRLRRHNEILQAQVHVLEIMDRAICANVHRTGEGYSEDVAWKLRKELAQDAENKAKESP